MPGPALELIGCGRSQRDVARLVAAIEDIDGVTRVTAQESIKPRQRHRRERRADVDTDECRTRPTIPKFKLVAAFDEVVPPGRRAHRPGPRPRGPGATATEAAPTLRAGSGRASAEQDADRRPEPGSGRLT